MNFDNVKIVIMAGGKGTRISSVASDIPKPMIDVCGKPVLEHQLACLHRQGIYDVTIVVGYLGKVICDYFGDGHSFGIKINYIAEKEPLGTAGALALLEYNGGLVVLINGDIIYDVDFERMINYHYNKNADITLLTHPNQHPYDSALIEVDSKGQVVGWLHKEDMREDYQNRVNAGIHVLGARVMEKTQGYWANKKIDLDRDIFQPNIKKFQIYAYDSPEYVKDMGTPERYYQVLKDYRCDIVQAKNLHQKQTAVFMDRDGTINKSDGFIINPEQMELLEGAAEAIKAINQSGCLAIVVTNQPVIARGDCSVDELTTIHNRLGRLLGEQRAYVDDLIYCPHHPHKGFEGERSEYKIDCDCRKPKPGMLFQMAGKYNIDLAQSYMIGDSLRDVQAGIAAGCKTIYIGENEEACTAAFRVADNLLHAVNIIFGEGTAL